MQTLKEIKKLGKENSLLQTERKPKGGRENGIRQTVPAGVLGVYPEGRESGY